MRLVAVNHITLDGVMQAPGRRDEDTRGGFRHGGWAAPRIDDVMQNALGLRLGKPNRCWLFGHRSYDILLESWNAQGGPYKEALIDAAKYVVSSNAATQLDWPNSTLVHGDIPTAIANLKERAPGDLVIMGSGELIRSLLPHELIDECLLMIHPVVLGSGIRLFEPDDQLTQLRLAESTATTTGVIIASYEPATHGAR